ncbi:MAG: hypothetical protein ACI4IA_04820 [Acutalibacteraceae bacterium]
MGETTEQLRGLAARAKKLGRQGFQTYLEMVDKVLDSIAGLAADQKSRVSQWCAGVLNNKTVRTAAPYTVLGAFALDVVLLAVEPFQKRRKK